MRRIGIREKGGVALIAAMAFVFFLTLFGLAFYRLGETDIDLFGHDKDLSKALYASEAGIEKVRWMLREVAAANPFDKAFNEADAISIANPTGGDFFPDAIVPDKPYFRVSMIQDASVLEPTEPKSKVRVRVLGSVDVDDDGLGGLTDSDADGFTFDPDDLNRRFEAYIGLPGTLGLRFGIKGISAAANAFNVGGAVSLSQWPRPFRTPDGDYVKDRNGDDRFLFYNSYPSVGIWDRWGFIFSDPAPTINPIASGEIDEVELPPGIFAEGGEYIYIDDDGNEIPDYFQDLDLRVYEGPDKTFDSYPVNDPTAGADGKAIIYVKGNIIIDSVDFGYLDDQGVPKGFDWEGYPSGEFDLTFIANGDIRVKRVDCGNVGRLVLVAKNIILEGDYNTKINGIAIALNDITLDGHPSDGGSWCEYRILTHQTDFSRPVKYAAYFLGSMVAGRNINLQNDGWAVIYDENVINGKMYSTTLSKPSLTYERVEAEDFNTDNNWEREGNELGYRQEDYTDADVDQGDYEDGGVDGTPELMKVYHDQSGIWRIPPEAHDFAVSDGFYCDFTNVSNVFEDSDITIGPQNWDNYTTIHFWMTLDNWERISGSRTTQRKSLFQLWLYDTNGNKLSVPLSYPNNNWVADPGKVGWKLVRITPHQLIDPFLSDFDLTRVTRFEFNYHDILVSWYINDTYTEEIRFDPTLVDVDGDGWDDYGRDGYYYYMKFNPSNPSNPIKYPIQFKPPDAYNRRQLYCEDPPYTTPGTGTPFDIRWYPDPSASEDDMYFEDTLDPLKSALNTVLRIDRIEVPGKPATNDYLNYGFPHCLRFEVTNWQEFNES